MLNLIRDVGAFAGLFALLGVLILIFLSFSTARDLRRLREWAGSAPERDAELVEVTTAIAAERSDELKVVEEERRRQEEAREAEERANALREKRRLRREAGQPEETRLERLRGRFSSGSEPGTGTRPSGWRLAAIIVAVIVLGGGVGFAALHVLNDKNKGNHSTKVSSRPGDIEVAVLNGTAVPNLAGRFGNKIKQDGYKLGNIDNSRSSFSESVVMFRRGHRPEAKRVGRDINIKKTALMNNEIRTAAKGAPVAVVVGEDRASSGG
jgi:hypothetical protein